MTETGSGPRGASPEPPEVPAEQAGPPAFAHASEAELARILDFYAVRWRYEPVTFPILWNLDGDVLESFSPDFYLPDLELYVELTTLKQRLVRKKNRKLRRLRELYPDIRIKLFYARDFRALMLKYGKLALADEMSGAVGQVTSHPESTVALRPRSARSDPGALPEPATQLDLAALPAQATQLDLAALPAQATQPEPAVEPGTVRRGTDHPGRRRRERRERAMRRTRRSAVGHHAADGVLEAALDATAGQDAAAGEPPPR